MQPRKNLHRTSIVGKSSQIKHVQFKPLQLIPQYKFRKRHQYIPDTNSKLQLYKKIGIFNYSQPESVSNAALDKKLIQYFKNYTTFTNYLRALSRINNSAITTTKSFGLLIDSIIEQNCSNILPPFNNNNLSIASHLPKLTFSQIHNIGTYLCRKYLLPIFFRNRERILERKLHFRQNDKKIYLSKGSLRYRRTAESEEPKGSQELIPKDEVPEDEESWNDYIDKLFDPEFDSDVPTNISAVEGQTVHIGCRVNNLGTKTVRIVLIITLSRIRA